MPRAKEEKAIKDIMRREGVSRERAERIFYGGRARNQSKLRLRRLKKLIH